MHSVLSITAKCQPDQQAILQEYTIEVHHESVGTYDNVSLYHHSLPQR